MSLSGTAPVLSRSKISNFRVGGTVLENRDDADRIVLQPVLQPLIEIGIGLAVELCQDVQTGKLERFCHPGVCRR